MSTYSDPEWSSLEIPENLRPYVFMRHPLTDQQKEIYNEFRKSLGDEAQINTWEPEEVWFTRFLIARQWNIENARIMYTATMKWRQETFPRRGSAENVLRQIRFRAFEYTGIKDRFGRPLVISNGKRANPGLSNSIPVMEEGFIWGMELLARMCRPPTNHFIHIMDLQDWSVMKNFDRKYMTATSKISQSYYPDYMGVTFVVNFPWAVWGAFKAAQLVLDPHTLEKCHFLSKEDSERVFRDLFDLEKLPQRFGGSFVEKPPSGNEFDKEEIKRWQSMTALPEEERERAFEAALEEFLQNNCTQEEAEFWRRMRTTDADPYLDSPNLTVPIGQPLGSSSSSSSSS